MSEEINKEVIEEYSDDNFSTTCSKCGGIRTFLDKEEGSGLCEKCKNLTLKLDKLEKLFFAMVIPGSILYMVVHIWTIGIAFKYSGIFAALVSSFFPVMPTIFWFFKTSEILGYNSVYHITAMVLIFLFIGSGILMVVIDNKK